MTDTSEILIAAVINDAEEIQDPVVDEARGQKPRLLIENCSPDQTVSALRDIFTEAGGLYDRAVPVRLAFDQIWGEPSRRRCRRMLGRQAAQDWIAGDTPISSSRGG